MIGKLKGNLELIRGEYAIIDVGGVGYRVFMTQVGLAKIATMNQAQVFIYTDVKEDRIRLFGFETLEELETFQLLLSISGVGPKAGLGILNIASPAVIKSAIVSGDYSILTKVSGIGKKTAERVVLELRNKIDKVVISEDPNYRENQDIIEALLAMGFSPVKAREAIKNIPDEVSDLSEKMRLAIKSM